MIDKKKMIKGMFVVLILISLVFMYHGINMHMQVESEEATFHTVQASYFSIDKATRDSASTGSELNNQLVEIKNYPSELMKLKLLGVGGILSGIYVLLLAILIALIMMPIRLGEIVSKK